MTKDMPAPVDKCEDISYNEAIDETSELPDAQTVTEKNPPIKDLKSRVFRVCPHKGRAVGLWVPKQWTAWLYTVIGLAALVWFLVRVVPKPSRVTYPCQRVAGPLAISFLLWLLGVSGFALAFRKMGGRLNRARHLNMVLGVALVIAGLGWVLLGAERTTLAAYPPHRPNTPFGVARGLQPGRVVWIHDPDVTDWSGPGTGERWHEHVDQGVAHEMTSQGLQAYSGERSDAAAWNALFAHHNGGPGYQVGQKIMIKINLTTAHAGSGSDCDDGHYNQTECGIVSFDSTANSPQMMHALLEQLVNVVGVEESDVTIGDPTGLFVNYLFNPLYDDFPDVNYLDNRGGEGEPGEWRTRAEYTEPCVPYYWSTSAADGKTQDCLLTVFDEATYVINFAVLKSHNCGGITVAAKNHYGSMLRTPTGYGRRLGDNYYNLHHTLPGDGCRDTATMKEMGQYRALVDLVGLEEIGGKTILYLVDGIHGGRDWHSTPSLWSLSPFDGDWPSSLFLSMDPVAIDSVAHDFLVEQWPEQVLMYEGVQDYLHESAMANEAPSGTCYDPERDGACMDSLGTHEHWNNSADKQYSRDLDRENGLGIELVYVRESLPPAPGFPAYLPLARKGSQ